MEKVIHQSNSQSPILKLVFLCMGWLSLLIAFVGAFLPILPTTPLVILAAYFFSKSSQKVHSWLTSIPYCGNAIIDWENNRVIRPRAKIMATFCILIVFSASIYLTHLSFGLKTMLACIGSGVLVFIHTRKSRS